MASAPLVQTRPEVLVLHSYSPDYDWTRSQQEGIDSVFSPLARDYALRIEYLDSAHSPGLLRSATLLKLYRAKLAEARFRLVLTSDNAALDFASAHRQELFPGVPIVFMGLNGYTEALLRDERGITGAAEDNDFLGTFEVGLRLFPSTKRIVIPGMAEDPSFRGNRAMVRQILPAFRKDVAVDFPEYPDIDAAIEALRRLPPDSAVVVMANMRTRDGKGVNSQRAVELVSEAIAAPVFTAWDFMVGRGAVGGSVTSGVEQGRLAAEIAVRILRGERPEDIPVHRGVGNVYLFDHRQLARFQIPASRLPPGAVVLFSPERTYKIPREAAWTAAFSLAALLLVVTNLVFAVRRRRRAEEGLRDANERFRAILSAATDYSVIGTDLEGRVVVFGEGSQLMLGYRDHEVMGRSVAELFHDPAEVAARAAELGVAPGFEVFVAAARRGGTETREWTYLRKDGQRLTVSLTVAGMHGPGGSLIGFIGIARDITGQKKVEQQLLQSQKMESVGLLAGGVAHDFNNLLTPILGYTGLLLDGLPPGDPRGEGLREIQAAAQRASHLTRQLLAFSRKQMLELKVLSLGDVVRSSESMLRRTLGETITIEVEVAPDLEAVRADFGQMEQVLLNLAINARDAMPRGGLLHIAARNATVDEQQAAERPDLRPGRHALLEVSDTGTGMTPEVQRKLFEPFFTTKELGKGTGLGLSTVYGIVRQHGGTITVYSEPGQGATFRVYLPVAPEAAAPPPAGRGPGAAPPARGGRETILVVEDSDLVRGVACDMLRRLGYRVLAASDGEGCLEVAGAHPGPIDLLLTDVVLPGMNGKEIAARLGEHRPALRVLFMSGYAANVIVHRGAVDEGVHFIQKPLSLDALASKVREALDGASRPALATAGHP
ncbi:MAG: response regulator [Deltaproteobacteria bacterium]|nr:response regulator [Deltaproteobacteria bacterium]